MADIEKILLVGTQSAYDALTPDSGKLYFCSDTRNMYKGSDLYTDGIRSVTTDPTTPATGVLYYNTTDDVLKFYDGSAWVTVRVAMSTSVTSASTDSQIPTAKAVYDYVSAAIEDATNGGDVVNSVTAGTKDATLTVTSGDNSTTVTVPGVVTTPSYDSTTRTITLPSSTGETLTIELGKDIFVQSGSYDADSETIILVLNDGTTTIEVPASGLVDVYTGGTTTTASVSVSSGNVITAAVTLSTDSNNSLVVDATNGGLLVDLSSYATQSYVDDAISALDTDLGDLEDRVAALESAVTLLNGDSSTAGSVAYQIAQAQTTLQAAIDTAQAAADAAQATADQNTTDLTALTTRVTTLENAFGFGTF